MEISELVGKSIHLWEIEECFNGDVEKITNFVSTCGFQSVILHSVYLSNWAIAKRVALAASLKSSGVHVIGESAVYGAKPVDDGRLAANLVNKFSLDAFVFDAEAQFDASKTSDSAASNMLKAYKNDTDKPAGWCWWAMYEPPSRKGTWHPKSVLWAATDPRYGAADFGMPMMYWSWGDDPASAEAYARESWRQWRAVTDIPIVPVGRAYIGDGGTAKGPAVIAFDACVRGLGASGVSWWSLQHALKSTVLPGVMDAIANLPDYKQVDQSENVMTWQKSIDTWARTMGYAGVSPEA